MQKLWPPEQLKTTEIPGQANTAEMVLAAAGDVGRMYIYSIDKRCHSKDKR